MSEIKLLPCPFCGGKAKVIENNYYTDIHSVMCKNCFSESDRYHTQEEAIKQWNTRKPMERIVAELEKEKEMHKVQSCNDEIFGGYSIPNQRRSRAEVGRDERRKMKTIIIYLLATIVLIVLFSTYGSSAIVPQSGGGMPTHLGNSGMAVPGDGKEFPESMTVEPPKGTEGTEETNGISASSDADKKDSDESNHKIINKVLRKETSMNEMVLAFWHGVVSVLIGEASAIMVVAVWNKIKRTEMKGV